MSPREDGAVAENAEPLVVETSKLTKIYGNRHIALNSVDLSIPRGCVVGLIGPNGAGKTTLLRLVLGLHRPSAGWVKVLGQKMSANAAKLRSRIGYIPTQAHCPKHLTPLGYLEYVAQLHGLRAEVRKPRMAALLRAVGLLELAGEKVATFSHGMVARLAVAASLINEPDLLIWDEPTHGLDPEARRSMLDLIKRLSEEKTLLIASHNLADIDEVCTHVAVLNRGHLVYQGGLDGLKGKMSFQHFELDLDGDVKVIGKACQTLKAMADFKQVNLRGRKLEVRLGEGTNAGALSSLFMTLADQKINVTACRSLVQPMEQALLDLLVKEEARGFSRACHNAEAA